MIRLGSGTPEMVLLDKCRILFLKRLKAIQYIDQSDRERRSADVGEAIRTEHESPNVLSRGD